MYRNSHYKDNIIMRLPYLYNGNSYTGKMVSLYWDDPWCCSYCLAASVARITSMLGWDCEAARERLLSDLVLDLLLEAKLKSCENTNQKGEVQLSKCNRGPTQAVRTRRMPAAHQPHSMDIATHNSHQLPRLTPILHHRHTPTPGTHLNIKTVFPRYGDFHVKDKTVARPSYL